MLWTDDAVEQLKRMARDGMSASVIAAALGADSRNAVIGKASRMGIRLGGGRSSEPGRPAPGLSASGSRPGSPAHPKAPRPDGRPGWAFADAEVGEMRRAPFAEIGDSACKWPIGDPGGGDFAFCGLAPAEGRSYCAGHCRIAYRPPSARTGRDEGTRLARTAWRFA